MLNFVHSQLKSRVVLGAGTLSRLADEIDLMGVRRVLVVSSPGRVALAERAAGMLGSRSVGIHAHAVMHVPVEVARVGQAEARRLNADCVLAVGGGSAIGLAKVITADSGIPILAVPTTYSGSEMTPIWGMTTAGIKTTTRDERVLPLTVIYDPELLCGLPSGVAAPSGINAMAHAVETLYAPEVDPLFAFMAEESIRSLAASLPKVVANPDDLEAGAQALYGAWLAAAPLSSVSLGLHHKLCHVLGGSFNLSHAEVHTVILPFATRYNASAAPDAMKGICRALGAGDAPSGIFSLSKRIGAPTALKDIGMLEKDLDRAVEIAMKAPYANPRPFDAVAIRRMLGDAFRGTEP